MIFSGTGIPSIPSISHRNPVELGRPGYIRGLGRSVERWGFLGDGCVRARYPGTRKHAWQLGMHDQNCEWVLERGACWRASVVIHTIAVSAGKCEIAGSMGARVW